MTSLRPADLVTSAHSTWAVMHPRDRWRLSHVMSPSAVTPSNKSHPGAQPPTVNPNLAPSARVVRSLSSSAASCVDPSSAVLL